MYTQIERRFKIGSFVGEGFSSSNGILQGCPLSTMLLNALMYVLHSALTANGRKATIVSFVDDLTILARTCKELRELLPILERFLVLTDQSVNIGKTKAFVVNGEKEELVLCGKVVAYADKPLKVLGVHLDFSEGYLTVRVPQKKIDECIELTERIRWSGLPYRHRPLLNETLVMAKLAYGLELAELTEKQERQLRTST